MGGAELSHNDKFIKVMGEYATYGFAVALPALYRYPVQLRGIMHWVLPESQKLRSLLKEAEEVVQPYVSQRDLLRASGAKVPNDAFEWVREISSPESWTPATFFCGLSVNSIHTTGDLLLETIGRVAENPELFQLLREEIVAAFTKHGLEKGALLDMKLLDSVMKECQRLMPVLQGTISIH